MALPKIDLSELTTDERLRLLEDVWDSLAPETRDAPLTDAQRTDLDRRLDEVELDDRLGIPWEDVLRRLETRPR